VFVGRESCVFSKGCLDIVAKRGKSLLVPGNEPRSSNAWQVTRLAEWCRLQTLLENTRLYNETENMQSVPVYVVRTSASGMIVPLPNSSNDDVIQLH
jgi:predicted ATP-grasp superfamily ATP-dependent carboligase